MSGIISHIGNIDSISDGMVRVRITQNSACHSCKIASHCSSAESKEKLIDVRCADTSQYQLGQEVNVMAASSVGTKAVLFAFVIPIVILLGTVAGCIAFGTSEVTAAVSAIVAMTPYYYILYLLRDRMERMLTFWIE